MKKSAPSRPATKTPVAKKPVRRSLPEIDERAVKSLAAAEPFDDELDPLAMSSLETARPPNRYEARPPNRYEARPPNRYEARPPNRYEPRVAV